MAAINFYDKIFPPMGFNRINCMKEWTAYTDGQSKIIICPTDEKYRADGFHRKKTGLNHLAFYAVSKVDVDKFYEEVLLPNGIDALYQGKPSGDDDYYAVFFEGPDRIKLDYVYAPKYCDKNSWPSNIADDFDPYEN